MSIESISSYTKRESEREREREREKRGLATRTFFILREEIAHSSSQKRKQKIVNTHSLMLGRPICKLQFHGYQAFNKI